jgi:predicted transcriptional regulator
MICQEAVLGKVTLLDICVRARKRAEQANLDIAAQKEVVAALERRGLDTTMAKAILAKIVAQRDADLKEMKRLLDEMDVHDQVSAVT